MNAQFAADYNAQLRAGKEPSDALEIATEKRAVAQAQINSSARETLFNLENQAGAAAAVTGAQQIQAQGAETYNKLVHDGVDATIAEGVAAQQVANARAKASAAVLNQVHSVEQQTEMLIAQANGNEAQVAAAQAYDNAIRSGASNTAAAALSAATLTERLTAAAIQADKISLDAQVAAEKAAVANGASAFTLENNAFGNFGGATDKTGASSTAGDPRFTNMLIQQAQTERLGVDGLVNNSFGGGLGSALSAVEGAPNTYGADPTLAAIDAQHGYDLTKILGPQTSNVDNKITAADNIVQLQNAQTSDKGAQVSNPQSEMAWLNTLPETIARDQKIVSLQQSIDGLKNATNANTSALTASLNPLYSQGHGALAIGYYKAANGLDGVAQGGTPGVDSVPIHIMAMPGEPIKVGAAATAANSNNPAPTTQIVNNNNFVFNGTSTSNARRSQRQFAQGFGQIAAAGG
jgi:hypothetical protein